MTALAILSIGIVAALGGLRTSGRLVGTSARIHKATLILEQQLDRIAADPSVLLEAGDLGVDGSYRCTITAERMRTRQGGVTDALGDTHSAVMTDLGLDEEAASQMLDHLRIVRVRVEWKDAGSIKRIEGTEIVRLVSANEQESR